MILKKITPLFFLFFLHFSSAQSEKSLYMKGNALFLPFGMANFGVEYQLSPKYTLEADIFASPWKSFAGNHAQVYMGHLETRYYLDEAFKHWYFGANIGAGIFDITKWNYSETGKYQRGFNLMFGAAVGYQFQWKERWNIDVFLGGGSSQGFYHGYDNMDNEITRYEPSSKWNKSGEFLPYRGGIMVSYKLK